MEASAVWGTRNSCAKGADIWEIGSLFCIQLSDHSIQGSKSEHVLKTLEALPLVTVNLQF